VDPQKHHWWYWHLLVLRGARASKRVKMGRGESEMGQNSIMRFLTIVYACAVRNVQQQFLTCILHTNLLPGNANTNAKFKGQFFCKTMRTKARSEPSFLHYVHFSIDSRHKLRSPFLIVIAGHFLYCALTVMCFIK
jgi:hypothetical protein